MSRIDIRDQRIALGLTQREVADYSGISLPHYQKLEYGNFPLGHVALYRALKLYKILNIPMTELVNADCHTEATEE